MLVIVGLDLTSAPGTNGHIGNAPIAEYVPSTSQFIANIYQRNQNRVTTSGRLRRPNEFWTQLDQCTNHRIGCDSGDYDSAESVIRLESSLTAILQVYSNPAHSCTRSGVPGVNISCISYPMTGTSEIVCSAK
jgi:hypothetical protein